MPHKILICHFHKPKENAPKTSAIFFFSVFEKTKTHFSSFEKHPWDQHEKLYKIFEMQNAHGHGHAHAYELIFMI